VITPKATSEIAAKEVKQVKDMAAKAGMNKNHYDFIIIIFIRWQQR